MLQRYTYTLGAVGLVLLAIPAVLPQATAPSTGRRSGSCSAASRSSRASSPGWRWRCSSPATWWPSGTCWRWPDAGCSASTCPGRRDLGPVLIAWAASLLILIFETDIGTSALFFGLFVVMLYIATQRTSWLLIGVGAVPRRARS